MSAAFVPVATIPKIAPPAPVSILRTPITCPPGFISTIKFWPVGSSVFPTMMLPLKRRAELIGPFSGAPAKRTRARDPQRPANCLPLDLTDRQPACRLETLEITVTELFWPSTTKSASCRRSYCRPEGPRILPGGPPLTGNPVAMTLGAERRKVDAHDRSVGGVAFVNGRVAFL